MTMTAWVNAIDSVKVQSGSYNMVYVLWEGIAKQFSRNQWKDTSGRTLGSGTFKFCSIFFVFSNSIFAQIRNVGLPHTLYVSMVNRINSRHILQACFKKCKQEFFLNNLQYFHIIVTLYVFMVISNAHVLTVCWMNKLGKETLKNIYALILKIYFNFWEISLLSSIHIT